MFIWTIFFYFCPSIILIQERSSINLVLWLSHVITCSIFSAFEFVCHICAGIHLCRIYTLFLQFNNADNFCSCCKFLILLCRSYRMESSQCGFQFHFYRVLKLSVAYLRNLLQGKIRSDIMCWENRRHYLLQLCIYFAPYLIWQGKLICVSIFLNIVVEFETPFGCVQVFL